MTDRQRCNWCQGNPVMVAYHDTEWGVEIWDARGLREALVIDCFQAGPSWRMILHKREASRAAF